MVAHSKLPVMMNDDIDPRYLNGKIYLVKYKYDDNMIYVGSTKLTLEERMREHRKTTKESVYSLYDKVCGDWDNWYIELYENYPCNNKQELERREGIVIKQIATINKNIAGRTKKEYYRDNRDKISEMAKELYQDNRNKILEERKVYRNANSEKIAIKKAEKTTCNICGSQITKDSISKHRRTIKCQSYKMST